MAFQFLLHFRGRRRLPVFNGVLFAQKFQGIKNYVFSSHALLITAKRKDKVTHKWVYYLADKFLHLH